MFQLELTTIPNLVLLYVRGAETQFLFQRCQARFQGIVALLKFCVALFQSLNGYHHDAVHVCTVYGGFGSNSTKAIVPEGSKELLGRRAIVPELCGVVPLEVPASYVHLSNLC